MPAHAAPTSHGDEDDQRDVQRTRQGRCSAPPTDGGENAASRYWPSTPMLNRFIRKPMATATRRQVVRRRLVEDVDLAVAGWSRTSSMSPNASTGLLPVARMHQGGDDERGDDRQQRRRDARSSRSLSMRRGQLLHRASSSCRPPLSRWPVAAPVMAEPSSSGVTVAGSASATSRPRYDHPQGVGQADQLVQVGGDQQHGQALAAGRRGCGPRSRPARRRPHRGSGGRR